MELHRRRKERDELATVLDGLTASLTEHLDAEEQHILPLAAKHLTEQEWQQLGEEGLRGVPKKLLPLVFGMLTYQGDPAVIASTLAHAPRLARLLMPMLAPRVHARYARRIHGTTTP